MASLKQVHIGANIISSGKSTRQESAPALISANFFISTLESTKRNKSINFHQKYELWKLRVLGKIVNLFHNNMQAQLHC